MITKMGKSVLEVGGKLHNPGGWKKLCRVPMKLPPTPEQFQKKKKHVRKLNLVGTESFMPIIVYRKKRQKK